MDHTAGALRTPRTLSLPGAGSSGMVGFQLVLTKYLRGEGHRVPAASGGSGWEGKVCTQNGLLLTSESAYQLPM